MGENKNPNQNQNQNIGQNPNQNPSKDRESATTPGKQFPGEQQEPSKERASNPNQDQDDAAKRQSRQDPLQQNNKDRDR